MYIGFTSCVNCNFIANRKNNQVVPCDTKEILAYFTDTVIMSFPVKDFVEFLDPHTNRCEYITSWLKKRNIDCVVISLDEAHHVYVNFRQSAYNPMFKIKTIVAHYDRAKNTPGANDNSAAVFQILSFTERLHNSDATHNIRIFFTDGEELGENQGIADQGSYAIAVKFKKLGILHDDIFVFDCCGRGDVIVVSTAGQNVKSNRGFAKKFDDLFARTTKLAQIASPQKWISLPVPYSDNASFIAAGIPAVAITILPHDEATKLMLDLRRDKGFEQQLLQSAKEYRSRLPLTWQIMHTPQDNAESLSEESFTLMGHFLNALARSHTVN